MKKFRKLTAMVTALCLAGCMMASMTAFAESEPETGTTSSNSITIKTNVNDENSTYTAYQVFKGTLNEDGSELTITDWGSGVNGTALLAALKEATSTDEGKESLFSEGVSFENCSNAAEVADVVTNFKDKSDDANLFAKLAADNTIGNGTKVSNTETTVDAGYYVIKGGSGDNITKYILKVVGNVNVELKIGAPKAIKKVKENTKNITGNTDQGFDIDATYNDVADWNIGDAVPFQLYGSMPDNIDEYKAYRYIFHDTIDKDHFDLTNTASSIKVTIDGETVTPDKVTVDKESGEITIEFYDIKSMTTANGDSADGDSADGDSADGNSIVVVDKDSIVKVDYTAVLAKGAVIGLTGQENEVYLEYSNNPNWDGTGKDKPNDEEGKEEEDTTNETEKDKVIVFTYEIDVTKIDGVTKKALSGAEFTLYTDKDCTNAIYVDADGKVCKSTDTGVTSELVSGENGKFIISGLDDGTYYLKETKAPKDVNGNAYNMLEEPIKVVISASTENNQEWKFEPSDALTALSVTADGEEAEIDDNKGIGSFNVENNKGTSLPSTGGIGTTLFYMVGGVLVVGAGVTLIAKKRVKDAE